MNGTRALITLLVVLAGTLDFVLAYQDPTVSIQGWPRFVIAVAGFMATLGLAQIRSWRDADEEPLTPVTHTRPQHEGDP